MHGEPRGNLGEELLQQLLWDVRLAHRYDLHGPPEVRAPGVAHLDASPKIVLLAVNDDAGVPDTVDLPAQQRRAHGPRHTLRQVVEVEGYLVAALSHRDDAGARRSDGEPDLVRADVDSGRDELDLTRAGAIYKTADSF